MYLVFYPAHFAIIGRSVDCAILKKVFQNLYLPLLPKGTFPFVFIDMKVNPARLDVNIHPTKKEVKFAREDDVAAKIMQWGETCLQEANRSRTFLTQVDILPLLVYTTINLCIRQCLLLSCLVKI